jgi:hypothetical protein
MTRNKKNGLIEVDEKRAYEWCFEKGHVISGLT